MKGEKTISEMLDEMCGDDEKLKDWIVAWDTGTIPMTGRSIIHELYEEEDREKLIESLKYLCKSFDAKQTANSMMLLAQMGVQPEELAKALGVEEK